MSSHTTSSTELLALLQAIENSSDEQEKSGAMGQLFHLLYDELYHQAQRQRRDWHGEYTLNTTALVHEAYEKLLGSSVGTYHSRAHFLAVSARAMRQILHDYAKSKWAVKRGGGVPKVSLDVLEWESGDPSDLNLAILLELSEAMERLHSVHPDGASVLECRFFAGMTIEETAVALGVSEATVKRRWRLSKAWLYREMNAD